MMVEKNPFLDYDNLVHTLTNYLLLDHYYKKVQLDLDYMMLDKYDDKQQLVMTKQLKMQLQLLMLLNYLNLFHHVYLVNDD